ncbi:uncharacterized protein [Notamacropus eugenii]|uniref:uncharacterized protein isoform X2 n=1 Tax=Notamacropus eugenii TaxID=9315 RepID=UPI003B67B5E8
MLQAAGAGLLAGSGAGFPVGWKAAATDLERPCEKTLATLVWSWVEAGGCRNIQVRRGVNFLRIQLLHPLEIHHGRSVCRGPRPGPSREPGARGNGCWELQTPTSGPFLDYFLKRPVHSTDVTSL